MALIGRVIYWIATVIAALLVLGTCIVLVLGAFDAWGFKSENNILEAFVFIPALLIWAIGWGCRYILS
jgi:hypothetical protein